MKKRTKNHKHKKHNSKEGYNLALHIFGGVEFLSTKNKPLDLFIIDHLHLCSFVD
jgi:hypothetical protein